MSIETIGISNKMFKKNQISNAVWARNSLLLFQRHVLQRDGLGEGAISIAWHTNCNSTKNIHSENHIFENYFRINSILFSFSY